MGRKAKPKTNQPPAQPAGGITIHNHRNDFERMNSGLYTFDAAVGGGIPYRTSIEIAGFSFSGKTTLALYLSGRTALPDKHIWIADLEPIQGSEHLLSNLGQAGFQGDVFFTDVADEKGRPVSSEKRLDQLNEALFDERVAATILDNVTTISPVSEQEGSVGDANMGRRARIMGTFMRTATSRLAGVPQPCIAYIVNHLRPLMGVQGSNTPGGNAIHDQCATRIRLTPTRTDTHWVLNGKIIKRRYWKVGATEEFLVVIVPGIGVHPGLTAVQECVELGLADKSKEGRVSFNARKYGFFSEMVKQAADPDMFRPFQEALGV